MRLLTWFSPCLWSDNGGYSGVRNFLHGTAIGRFVVNSFWGILSGDVVSLNGYDSHPETAKLKPWTNAMFTGPSFSILNYETDFFDLVKSDKVTIHISDINHLSPGKVHLSNGTEFESDVLVANTGWKHAPPMKFLPEGIDVELGLPHSTLSDAPATDLANQQDLLKRADEEILKRFPRLKDQPIWNKNYVPLTEQEGMSSDDAAAPGKAMTPYMLYHFMVPASERFLRNRDIAFIGIISNFSNVLTAHLQGLWISAYFSGLLANDPSTAIGDEDSMLKLRYETVLHNRFGSWRYPTDWGNKAPSFIFDAVPYLDLLQRDLGLDPYRKGTGFMAEILDPYGPEDYRNVNEEWREKYDRSKLDD